jgi:hypothetical protein
MCFYIHSEHQEVKIATKDIVCYKILQKTINNNLTSPYQNALYFTKANTHPVIKKVKAFSFCKYNSNDIEAGLHSYSALHQARKTGKFGNNIHKAIIPKGTKYYYNPTYKQYVSLELKVWKRNLNK